MAISLIKDGEVYKALIRATQGSERLSVSTSAVPFPLWRKLFGLGHAHDAILETISRNIPVGNLKMVKEPNLPNELLAMEERQVIRSYKFGVGYVKAGQTTEEQMMANTMGNKILF